MSFKEKIKDTGRIIMGQGEEVEFKHDAEAYARSHGVSFEVAGKRLIGDQIRTFHAEMRARGVFDTSSESLKKLEAGLREILGNERLTHCRELSDDPRVFRGILMTPSTTRDLQSVETQFRRRFKGKRPDNFRVIHDVAQERQLFERVLARFAGDPRLGGTTSLEAALSANPELAADLGKALMAKEEIVGHERRF